MKKKLVFCFLVAVLVFATCAAVAADDLTIKYNGAKTISANEWAEVLSTTVTVPADTTITMSVEEYKSGALLYRVSYAIPAGENTLNWSIPFDTTMTLDAPIKRVKVTFEVDAKKATYTLYYNLEKNKDGGLNLTIEKLTWYPNNTACSFGPQFREVRPSLTDKWYMFTPLDLSKDGVQEFEYIAGNVYIIGKVTVEVKGDILTVNYRNYYKDQGGNTETKSEFYTFFRDLASVTEVEPEKMDDRGYVFGQQISIQNDLGGDTNVLLFIRNTVTYSDYVTSTKKLTRFWINLPERVTLRNAMLAMMD